MPRNNKHSFSRGVPRHAAPDEVKAFFERAKSDPEIKMAVERIVGIDIDAMTPQQFRLAYNGWRSSNFVVSEMVQMSRAYSDLLDESARMAGEISKDDQITLLKTQLEEQQQRFEAEIARVRDEFGLKK